MLDGGASADGRSENPSAAAPLADGGPLDVDHVRAAMDAVRADARVSASRHRITDRSGRERHVVMVGEPLRSRDGGVVGVAGHVVDVTPVVVETQDRLDLAVRDFVEHRSVIEQAKGMMMLAYGFGETHAYDVLAWRSQHTNTKVRALAAAVVREAPSTVSLGDADRAAFDRILLTAHEN